MTTFDGRCRMVLCLSLLLPAGCGAQNDDVKAEPTESPEAQTTDKQHGEQNAKSAKHTNRLARESSPYLLLHAHNPVDWHPWSPEAFEIAQREQKPVFLSIGYSSCYWCHVMERLVFEDEEIARYMNEHFVNIKVDREERPDVDDIYMTSLIVYLQAIGSSQGGGWPLSMFLTPKGKPIAGGSYFPPKDEGGRMSFPTVMKRVVTFWNDNRENVLHNANLLTGAVQRAMKPTLALTTVELERSLVSEAVDAVVDSFDPKFGGIDFNPGAPNAPKFPSPTKLALLQYQLQKGDDTETAKVIYQTLDRIQAGGIRDHLGGGFHRYSTDRRWHLPHFEKMLYDQAQLADLYVEAFRRTRKQQYRDAAEGIFTYVLRKMTDPRGGFYSALDAETDGVEGEYYVWSRAEVEKVLGSSDAEVFRRVYGMEEPKVFEHGYVLHLPQSIDEAATQLNLATDELASRLEGMRQRMLAAREKRESLLLDDKVLTSWNGLMIRALAHGAVVFESDEYLAAAEKAARFLLAELRDDRGQLRRTYRGGQAKLNAYLDDYAFLVEGLLALHQATGEQIWLDEARRLTDEQMKLFWDERRKAFFFTSHDHEQLIARTKNAYDAVLPSGNSVSIRNLLRLASLTNEPKYRELAKEALQVFAPRMKQSPRAVTNVAVSLGEYLDDADFSTSVRSR